MKPYAETRNLTLYCGDARAVLAELEAGSVQACVTSPPYFALRDYGHPGQFGLESTPDAYVLELVKILREVRRVLRNDGTLWLNLGDSYCRNPAKGQHKPGDVGKQNHVYERGGGRASATFDLKASGLKEKDLIGIPWRVALALQQPWLTCNGCGRESHQVEWAAFVDGTTLCPHCMSDEGRKVTEQGWFLRSDVIWHKPNALPNSVKDRPVTDHEYVFLLSKQQRYYFDHQAIKEPAKGGGQRSKRTVWSINTRSDKTAHFAVFPPELIRPMILASTKEGEVVLDPFLGSGTTAEVAKDEGRAVVGIELQPDYCRMAAERLRV